MAENKNTKLQIRNSTVDFLVFTKDAHEEGIEVRVQDHDVWLTQKAIGQLFDVDRSVVTKHLKNIYESGELSEESTCANFAQVADNLSILVLFAICHHCRWLPCQLRQGNTIQAMGNKSAGYLCETRVCFR